jgi:hypothetical protein
LSEEEYEEERERAKKQKLSNSDWESIVKFYSFQVSEGFLSVICFQLEILSSIVDVISKTEINTQKGNRFGYCILPVLLEDRKQQRQKCWLNMERLVISPPPKAAPSELTQTQFFK